VHLALSPELQERNLGGHIQATMCMLVGVEISDLHARETASGCLGSKVGRARVVCLPGGFEPPADGKVAKNQTNVLGLLASWGL
jgi:hypothetical protein